MSQLFYRYPRLLILVLLLILVSGLSSLSLLPRSEDPSLVQRFALVITRFPGATAERVEALVTEKVERKLKEFEEIKEFESNSRAGISVIDLTLGDHVGANEVDNVWSRLRDELGEIASQLPSGADAPEVETQAIAGAYSMILGLRWDLETEAQHALLRRYGKALEERLRDISGTEHTRIYGSRPEEIRVAVRIEALSGLGLSVDEMSAAIRAHDAKVAAGMVRSRQSDLVLEVEGEPLNLQAIRDIPLRHGPDGQVVRVGDVAEVWKTTQDPAPSEVYLSGRASVAVAVRMSQGRRIDQWAETVQTQLEEFRQRLPHGISLVSIFDQSDYVAARFNTLGRNLWISTLLVIAVSFLFMGWRAGILVGSALPMTMLMVTAGMRFFGIPLHQMSVTGLIIALGMLIDNAIVMVDETRSRLREGMETGQAVGGAVSSLFVPLLGSTLTTVFAFMPLVLMPGPAGEFVGSIGLTVTMALISSLFLSMTVVPTFTGWLEGRLGGGQGRGWFRRGIHWSWLDRLYRQSLRWTAAKPWFGLSFALVLPVIGFAMQGGLREQFFPPAERDQFHVQLSLPRGTALQHTRNLAFEARKVLSASPKVEESHWFVGSGAPSFYYNMMSASNENTPYFAQALVKLKSSQGSLEIIRSLQGELDRAIPGAQILALPLEQGPPFKAPIELRVFGPDLQVLQRLSSEARSLLSATPSVLHTRSSLESGQPKLWLRVDPSEVQLAGLNQVALAGHLQAGSEGWIGGSLMEQTEELPIRVRWSPADRNSVHSLLSTEIPRMQADGQTAAAPVPLSVLGEPDLIPELAEIPRRNGRRVATVQGFLPAGVLPAGVLQDFEQRLLAADFEAPPGYRWEFGGESEERNEAIGNLMASVGLLLTLILTSLVLSFRSFRMAAVIAAVGALSIGLGLAALWTFQLTFGFMAIVGTMGLVGVAINDSIVVLAALRNHPKARHGDQEAVVEVVHHATRHILTTTVTTIAGFMPLILSGGAFWPPLAVAIAGGVVGATILALFFVPSAFLLLGVRAEQTVCARIPACPLLKAALASHQPAATA
ncbi:MAG: AcrB/AcrD/AcrF family protein [Planctomycetota bacterium]|nr:MAG: AcrB/AcrD/AcrF family protein [Planctomycetota bacterium]